jgi:hypothetical protein
VPTFWFYRGDTHRSRGRTSSRHSTLLGQKRACPELSIGLLNLLLRVHDCVETRDRAGAPSEIAATSTCAREEEGERVSGLLRVLVRARGVRGMVSHLWGLPRRLARGGARL